MFEVWQGQPQSHNLPCNDEGKGVNIANRGIITIGGQTNQTGKQAGNPPCPALMKGCPIGTCTSFPLCLNATSLSSNSFILSLMSALTLGPLQTPLTPRPSHPFLA